MKLEWQYAEDASVLQELQKDAKWSTVLYKYYNNIMLDSFDNRLDESIVD